MADDDLLVTPPDARISHSRDQLSQLRRLSNLGLVLREFVASIMLAPVGGFTEKWPVQA